MCALGMTVYRRARVNNSTVFWVVVVVFRILSWAVTPWATNHHRAAKKTEGWTDPSSIQGESKRHQAVLMKHSNREPHSRHHPTQSWNKRKGTINVLHNDRTIIMDNNRLTYHIMSFISVCRIANQLKTPVKMSQIELTMTGSSHSNRM